MTSDQSPWLVTCIGVATDLPLLPHFLKHYQALGVASDRMLVILNATASDHPGLAQAREILQASGVRTSIPWIAPYTSETMWQQRREVQNLHCGRVTDWVISADVDEFHEYPEPLPTLVRRIKALDVTCVQGVFIDRLKATGRLGTVQPTPDILEQFPLKAEVSLSIGGRSAVHGRGGTVKMMLSRGDILPGRGGHRPQSSPHLRYLYNYALGDFAEIDRPEFRFDIPTRVHHIHWTDTLSQRLGTRLATPGVSPAGAAYGKRQLDHIAQYGGINLQSIAIDNAARDLDWEDSLKRLRAKGRRHSLKGSVKALARKVVGR